MFVLIYFIVGESHYSLSSSNDGFSAKIKDKFALGSANFVSTIINSLFFIFLASFLDKTEYGELSYLLGIAYVGWAFANFGIDRLIIVYGAKNVDIFNEAYLLTIISGTIVSIIVYFLTFNFATSVLIWGFLIFMVHVSKLNSQKNFLEQAKHTIVYRIFMVVSALVLYTVYDINGIILGGALAAIPTSKWIISLMKTKKFNFSILKSKFQFMLYNYFQILTLTLFTSGDKILIGPIYGFEILGSYAFALQYVYALNALPVSLMMYLLPNEAQNQNNKKLKIYSVLLSALLSVILITVASFVVDTFFPQYNDAILLMQITSIAIIPWVISVIFEAQFIAQEKSMNVLISTASQTILYFVLILILGDMMGIVGLALSFVLSTILRCSINSVLYLKSR